MIYSLSGKLIYSDQNFAVVECGGVGYKCSISLKTLAALPKIGEDVFLYTYLAVREDSVDLFGFISKEELESFKLITGVNGVGAKVGIAVLSQFEPQYLYSYISSGDYKALTAAAGVGVKLAQRIVLELKDKIGSIIPEADLVNSSSSSSADMPRVALGNLQSASAALVSLGFTQAEANKGLSGENPNDSVEQLIKKALAKFSSGNF